jgi:PRTRC genetic system protein A
MTEPYTLSGRDRSIQAAMPVVIAPVEGELPPVEIDQVRHVVTRDGLMIEARTKAAHCLMWLAQISETERPLPYGSLHPHFTLAGGNLPTELLREIVSQARAALPNEWAGCVIWRDSRYQLITPPPVSASPHRISYSAEGIDPSEIAFDVHSHGTMMARFSGLDDRDDRLQPTACFMSGIVGRLDLEICTSIVRFVVNGRFYNGTGSPP